MAHKNGDGPHQTKPVLVWADIDLDIVEVVEYLNSIPGVRTEASCQGTIGEGGPNPYRAQVMVIWPEAVQPRLQEEFDVEVLGTCWGYVRPKGGAATWDTFPGRKPEAEPKD